MNYEMGEKGRREDGGRGRRREKREKGGRRGRRMEEGEGREKGGGREEGEDMRMGKGNNGRKRGGSLTTYLSHLLHVHLGRNHTKPERFETYKSIMHIHDQSDCRIKAYT